jgi:CopG family nickel-responsive transcriptional regulator
MSDLIRLSLSIEKPLLDRLEKLVKRSGYTNRSEFVRDMIRERLVEREWDENQEVVGTITLVYDHHVSGLSEKLTDVQHHHHRVILTTTHVHLDKALCVEMILVKGRPSEITELADLLRQNKGVLHAGLSTSTTGTHLR